ncbi:MAG TPA: ATP-binding protein [Chthoniobacter sp.]|nr:ATP-binding protein [Chthoniobacter sp.]
MRSIDQATKALDLIRDCYLLDIDVMLDKLKSPAFEPSANLEGVRAAMNKHMRLIKHALKGVETTVAMTKLELTVMSGLSDEKGSQEPAWVESLDPVHLRGEIAAVKDFVLRDFGGDAPLEYEGSPAAYTDINAIRLVVKILLENAHRAITLRSNGIGQVWKRRIDLVVKTVGSQLTINVVDTGIGIDESESPRLSQMSETHLENTRDADYRVVIQLCELARKAGKHASFQFIPNPQRAMGGTATFTCELRLPPARMPS